MEKTERTKAVAMRIIACMMAVIMVLTAAPFGIFSGIDLSAGAANVEDSLAAVPSQTVSFSGATDNTDTKESVTVSGASGSISMADSRGTVPISSANGKVKLKSGNYAKWINRIADLPQYAKNFYDKISSESFWTKSNKHKYTITKNLTTGDINGKADEMVQYLGAAYAAFIRDNPGIFWDGGIFTWEYTYTGSGNNWKIDIIITLSTPGYKTASDIADAIKTRNSAVKTILKGASSLKTDYEKIKYFNKWLVKHNEYNTYVAVGNDSAAPREAWTCISALTGRIGKKGPVCEGYAEAFKYLCDRSNIPCVIVIGDVHMADLHMWNNVKLDGKWYAVDVTWNDPSAPGGVSVGAVSGYESEDYLAVGAKTVVESEKFSSSHVVLNTGLVGGLSFTNGPKLNSSKYNPKSSGGSNTKITTIPKCTVKVKSSVAYTGKALKPAVTVKAGNKTLKKGTHYTVKYTNNKEIGVATVTVTGIKKNGYSGKKTVKFKIVPAKVKNLKAKSQTKNSITLSWKKVAGAKSYIVYSYNSKTKKYTKLTTVKTNKITVTNLKAGTKYSYAVAAKASSQNGAKSAVLNTATKTKAPKLKGSAGYGEVYLTWDEVGGETGYTVYIATSKNGTYENLGSFKKTEGDGCRVYNLVSGEEYYFKVKAYKKVDGKKINSAFSNIVKIKVK